MSRPAKSWLLVAVGFLAYALVVWWLPGWIGLAGREATLLRGGLLALGVVAFAAVGWFLHRRAAARAAAEPAPDADTAEIDAAVATAQQKLAGARAPGGGRLGTLPVVLVVGPTGAAKSTVLARGGLEPELLAGEAFAAGQLVPTRLVNLWYARGTVFAEAGGQVAAEAGKRARLLQRLRPQSLGAALGRGRQAPRAAVVCFPCDALLAPGATDAVPAAARALRATLLEAATAMGIRLPVYVLFTKADRIAGFADFVQNLTADEVREVLGATLPPAAGDGTWAERETARLSDAFRALFESLAARRLTLLPREHAAERRPGAYEFPREFRKVAPLAIQFLVELGKPSQLAASAFVRGFYFTGVRAIVITERAAPAAAASAGAAGVAGAAPAAPAGATGVFGARAVPASANGPVPAAPVLPGAVTKKPQWVFLERVLPEVVLADEAARRATEGGTRVHGLRRALLAAAALLALVVGGGLTASWLGNRALERRTLAAARAATAGDTAAAAGALAALPPVETLRRLDSLRVEVARLGAWRRDGAPVRLRWGLYTGDRLEPDARRLYFARFEQALFADTRAALQRTLGALPTAPTGSSEYGPTYDALKAYLITTDHPQRSTVPFLAPVLLRTWLDGRELDPARTALAERQFAFYAEELARENPYAHTAEVATVEGARRFLRQFEGQDRIYQFMTSEAAAANPGVQFNRDVPGSAAFVVNAYEVPGAYTRGGWTFMQDALANVDRFLAGEEWVLGPETGPPVDRRALADSLRARYERDFVQHWRGYLAGARVVRGGGLEDAARRLQALSAPQSPLFAMLALASRNTRVDSAGPVRKAFQPVHVVSPPELADRYAGEAAAPYLQALAGLFAAVEGAAKAPPGQGAAAAQQATGAASQAKLAVNQVAQGFTIDPVGRVETTVQRLLTEPIVAVEPLLGGVGAGELNAAGASFCANFSGLMAKYPFNPNATVEATVDEVAGMFKPGSGLMWQYYDEVLQPVYARQGNQIVPRPGSDVAPNRAFQAFFNRAAEFAAAVFRDGSDDPRLSFALRPVLNETVQGMSLTLDGEVTRFSRTATDMAPLRWQAGQARSAQLGGQLGGGAEVGLLGPYRGAWALFRLFHSADRWQAQGGTWLVQWTPRVSGQAMTTASGAPVEVAVELNLGGLPPILQRGWFGDLRCVSRVAQ